MSKHEIYSGWFICDTTERDSPYPREEIEKVAAWEVVQHKPELSQVLAMTASTSTRGRMTTEPTTSSESLRLATLTSCPD